MRLTTDIWVAAFRRKVEAQGAAAYLRRRGEERAGAVVLKICHTGLPPHEPCATALSRVASMEGGGAWSWLAGPEQRPEADVDALLERQVRFDPDLWIVEIEDRDGRSFVDEAIL
ncbi:MAG: DUF1491 family protein [Pseudomonadota bacterium]